MFSEKLIQLMTFYKITNNRLAKVLSVDPSLISRWRSGSREPSSNSNYYNEIARYFSQFATSPNDIVELLEALQISNKAKTVSLETELSNWLRNPNSHTGTLINNLLSFISENSFPSKDSMPSDQHLMRLETLLRHQAIKSEPFRGNKGKRLAVIKFLAEAAKCEEKKVLYLFSNEKMDWLTEDANFYKDWALLLRFVLSKGHQIKIIHTLSRGIDELLFAVKNWLPLYMTGMISPYYIPESGDGLFKKSIFILEDVMALSSTSVANMPESLEQFLYLDKTRVGILQDEFNTLLKLSRPLMKIVTNENAGLDLAEEFLSEAGTLYISNHLRDLQNIRIQSEAETFEIIHFPIDKKQLSDHEAEQLNLRINLLNQYKNYHLFVMHDMEPNGMSIFIKHGTGVIVIKNDLPKMAFAFNHLEMVSAFETYIQETIKSTPSRDRNRKDVLYYLKSWITPPLQ